MSEPNTSNPAPHEDDLFSEYANNSHFEPSVWDLKILFGQLHPSSGKGSVDWHAAITMPWAQAKLLSYFLRVNIAVHEFRFGKIAIPEPVLPQDPADYEAPESSEVVKVELEIVKRLYREFLLEQLEIPRTAQSIAPTQT